MPATDDHGPRDRARPARSRNAPQAARNVRRVFVYPTAPTPTRVGSGMDVDKVPAAVNALGARQIERTGSLNIADALQQQVPGIIVSERPAIHSSPTSNSEGLSHPRGRYASGTRSLPERYAHQRGIRRHRQLGSDSDRRDQVGHRRHQQSRVRAQCAGRGGQCADEGRLQLSRRRDQHDGRLVRPHPEFGAMGQADRQLFRLWRPRGIA